jgi:hypothetical protein
MSINYLPHLKNVSKDITIMSFAHPGLCNNIKNFLSTIRIKKHIGCSILIDKKNELNEIFDFSTKMYYDKEIHKDVCIYIRNSWRFSIFDTDKNLDKIIDDKFSLMFSDFNEYQFLKNYKNNCIDFVYEPSLFNDIYIDYAKIFNELEIKNNVSKEINNFYDNYFNENTISVHLRSWVDCGNRAKHFDITKFYEKIEELNNGINTFFISSDNKNLCYDIKNKFGDKIIIYESKNNSNLINSFIELMLLSKTNTLIGTYISTFTELAYVINYNI